MLRLDDIQHLLLILEVRVSCWPVAPGSHERTCTSVQVNESQWLRVRSNVSKNPGLVSAERLWAPRLLGTLAPVHFHVPVQVNIALIFGGGPLANVGSTLDLCATLHIHDRDDCEAYIMQD